MLFVANSCVQVACVQELIEQELGWQVSVVSSSDTGLAWTDCQYPQIILTGVRPAGYTGPEFIAFVRDQFGDVPIVLLTGDGDDRSALEALQAGATSYVPTDMIASDLTNTLARVLTAAQTQTRRRRLNAFLHGAQLEYSLENDPALIAPLVAALQEQLSVLGICSVHETLRLGIALEEALLNGIQHGNLEVSSELRQDHGEQVFAQTVLQRRQRSPYCNRRLYVHARVNRVEGAITIRDEGPGFDVGTLPNPTDPENLTRVGGRGILLMRTFMDEVRFNAKGNEVTLLKRRKS